MRSSLWSAPESMASATRKNNACTISSGDDCEEVDLPYVRLKLF